MVLQYETNVNNQFEFQSNHHVSGGVSLGPIVNLGAATGISGGALNVAGRVILVNGQLLGIPIVLNVGDEGGSIP